MKLKKNMKKAGVGLLVSAIAISGAFAWLKSSDTASKTNQLKVGGAKIIFDNQLDSVSLVDNSAIPMTKANAIANLTAYTFDIKNEGEVHLDYTISVDGESYLNTFDAGKVNVLIAPIADGASAEEIKTALTNATIQRLSSGVSLTSSNLQAGTHQRYALIAFVDRNTKLAEYTGKEVSFKLRVDAVQHNVLNAENYETLTKSQINTTVTVGGETKNVDVYNIEGESKTDLLNKLQASGLTDTSTVDAIVEVKGEDYDGINSTATFDVSSIANPGDEVVILHYNETTQEWEYVGRETVGEDNTVSGDFTSYSPVAFIVYKPDGSIVTKEYDSDTGELIKETEVKTDGSKIETEYDNGEVSNVTKTEAPVAGGIDEQGYLAINAVNFPDEIFRNYVATKFDEDSDGKLSTIERDNVIYISVSNKKISSLSGIEYFPNLHNLSCDDNNLTTLDVSNNVNLEYLYCSNNNLTTLDVSKNVNLRDLRCTNNNLTTLDVSKNVNLQILENSWNKLTILDVSNNVNLRNLNCSYNNNLTTLDVSNNVNLEILECDVNKLTALDVSKNVNLTFLNCNYNKLTALDVSNNVNLTYLGCVSNKLTTLDLTSNPLLNSDNVRADASVTITYHS